MAHEIDDKTIEYVSILAQLTCSGEEKEAAKRDMEQMLDYIDKLNELDTKDTEPMTHIFPLSNVFREDVTECGSSQGELLRNAPESKDGAVKVPKTVE